MDDIELSPGQLALAKEIGDQMAESGYVLVSYDIFGQYFDKGDVEMLKFVLSTNAWTTRLDEVLKLVVITEDNGVKPTWPIKELLKQVREMERSGIKHSLKK